MNVRTVERIAVPDSVFKKAEEELELGDGSSDSVCEV